MKFNLKRLYTLLVVFCFLTIFLLSVSGIAQAVGQNLFVKAAATFRTTIPVYQDFKILEQKDIDYSFLMQNYNGSREIMVEEALTIEVLSNADWNLSLNNRNLNSEVMIKKSSQSKSAWQNLNSKTAEFNGENGVRRITFDLKFILDQSSRTAIENLALDLRHSLVPELY